MIPVKPTGSGTEDNPWKIAGLDNLLWLSQTESVWGDCFIQTADIDAEETRYWNERDGIPQGFSPIGFWESSDLFRVFEGRYNGNGHKIRGLYISRGDSAKVGLFGYVWKAVLEYVRVVDAVIVGGKATGILAGDCFYSEIRGIRCTGAVTGKEDVGGLAGSASDCRFSCCRSSASVNGKKHVGGLVGSGRDSLLRGCRNGGRVIGEDSVGGLVGWNDHSRLSSCRNSGSVDGKKSVGGLAGWNDHSRISGCRNRGCVREIRTSLNATGLDDHSDLRFVPVDFDAKFLTEPAKMFSCPLNGYVIDLRHRGELREKPGKK